jgi:hypothetical protein
MPNPELLDIKRESTDTLFGLTVVINVMLEIYWDNFSATINAEEIGSSEDQAALKRFDSVSSSRFKF